MLAPENRFFGLRLIKEKCDIMSNIKGRGR